MEMGQQVGVWIDHRHAVIVSIQQGKETTLEVESGVEPRVRLAGGSRSSTPYGPQDIASDGKRDRRHIKQLTSFYRRVIELIHDADEILICGPGEAKLELKKIVDRSSTLARRVVGVETADKMTRRQFAAKVRGRFTE
jgi:hypothetical protein